MAISEQELNRIVNQVLKNIQQEKIVSAVQGTGSDVATRPLQKDGVFADIDSAVEAAARAQKQLIKLGFEKRKEIIAAMRKCALDNALSLAELAVAETKMGRVADKKIKNVLVATKTPGVEDLPLLSRSGDETTEFSLYSPIGVIAAITPVTNPTATVINNGISMIAAGNAVVFNPHPSAKNCTIETMQRLNRAIVAAGGPENLMTSVADPTLRTSAELMKHPKVNMIAATGGGGVVRAAMTAGKKVIAAGPGNPPVIVDETADIASAAKYIVQGSSFDNNMPCVCEKELIVIRTVADKLIDEMQKNGAYLLQPSELNRLAWVVLNPDNTLNKNWVGKDAKLILAQLGITVSDEIILIIVETNKDHPFVQEELMMPILPIVRVTDFDEAVRVAVEVEHGFRHTALIHSKNIDRITAFAKAIQCTLFAANTHCGSTLGYEADGPTSFTIAGPTGEGPTTARHFTRARRLVLRKSLEIS
ncbi:MAG: aldehyde dehydrogenase EutE [bacterium]|nr:aldehyde dehydrogenase EutE [bacterium]